MKKFDKIYVEITNICNLNCSFCIDTNRKKEFMSLDNFELVISKIKNYTNLIALHIKGEPLIHPKLKHILDVCFDNNILVNITTNGTLLNENIQLLSNSKSVRQINLSMHSINKSIQEDSNKIFKAVKKIHFINSNIIVSYRLWNLENIKENNNNIELLKLIGKEYNIKDIINRSKNEKFIKLDEKVFLNQDVKFDWPDLRLDKISDKGKCYRIKKSYWNFGKWRCCTLLFR